MSGWKWLAGVAAFIATAALLAGGNAFARYQGWIVPRLSPAALSAKLSPYYRVIKPDGDGPFPTALLFSGCDGPKDNLDRWAAMLNAHGWAAIIVDSHSARGFGDLELRLICTGQLLMGSERAGDILVSIDDARHMPFVDPTRLALIGASHGGWSVMDLLELDPPRRLPFNLASLPDGSPADPLEGVTGVILLYPYCGIGNRARGGGWSRPMPTLFLLGGEDSVAPADACIAIADAMRARGLPVRAVTFAAADHAFDQVERAPFGTKAFDPEVTAEALRLGAAFLAAPDGP